MDKTDNLAMGKVFGVLTIFMSLLTFSQNCKAWLLFEPYIGYNRGQQQASRIQGIGYGARIGLETSTLFVAADIAMSDLQQGALSSVKYTDTGVSLGGEVKSWRIWYGLISSVSFSYPSGANTIVYKGAGTKIGIGAPIGSKTFLNLELKTYDFTTSDNAGTVSNIAEIGTLGFLNFSWVF